MKTPEAIVVAICVVVFVMVLLCTCMLKSSLIDRLQKRLDTPSDGSDKTLQQTTTTMTILTKETVLID